MRVANFGKYGVFTPYQSHDGKVGWTVQIIEPEDDIEDAGEIIAEFTERFDAGLFAKTKHADDMTHDELRQAYDGD